jgi:hypothetical protein
VQQANDDAQQQQQQSAPVPLTPDGPAPHSAAAVQPLFEVPAAAAGRAEPPSVVAICPPALPLPSSVPLVPARDSSSAALSAAESFFAPDFDSDAEDDVDREETVREQREWAEYAQKREAARLADEKFNAANTVGVEKEDGVKKKYDVFLSQSASHPLHRQPLCSCSTGDTRQLTLFHGLLLVGLVSIVSGHKQLDTGDFVRAVQRDLQHKGFAAGSRN